MTKVCTTCSVAVDEVELDAPFDSDKRGFDDDGVVAVSLTEYCGGLEESAGLPELYERLVIYVESCLKRLSTSILERSFSRFERSVDRYRPLVNTPVLRSLNGPVSYSVSPSANISWRRSACRSADSVDSTSISKAYRSPSNR